MSENEVESLVISKEGTITLPQAVLDQHGWVEGTVLEIVEKPQGVLVRAAPSDENTQA